MKLNRTSLSVMVLIGMIILSGCAGQEKGNAKQENELTLKGISLSPKSFQQDDFKDFFEKAKQAGSIVSWAGDWNELSNSQSGGPAVVASLASTYDYTPVIELQFFSQSSGKLIRPFDDATKQDYENNVIAFVEKYQPKYLSLGIEVNILYEKSPKDFDNFVSFYNKVYDAVKAKSPNTKVFTIFQLEKLKGLQGGLFGGTNEPGKSEWQLLDRFKTDIIAFTTYPGLIYKSPSEISADYYTEIKSHATKPVVFTELGWHSDASPAGWESSEEEQAEFIENFFSLTKDLHQEFSIWSFLYDQNAIEPFNSMGLFDKEGKEKLSWDKWIAQS